MNAGSKNMHSMHHPQRQNVATSKTGLKMVIVMKNLIKKIK